MSEGATFRSLLVWPHPQTRDRRRSPFRATWSQTLRLLQREVRHLDGRAVMIAAGFREGDIRRDGWPRSDARVPPHPGVEVSFDSRHGRLVYATDACTDWQDNVRSIALGLEALRAVDRYGVTRRGEQYAGWRELSSGSGLASAESAWKILTDAAGEATIRSDETDDLEGLYRRAARATHPDSATGSAERFVQVKAAYDFLKGAA